MTKLQPSGMFATPYGVEVPVYRPSGVDLGSPDGFAFTPEAVAYTAGIYRPQDRARFVEDATRLGAFPAFEPYGGQRCPHRPLPRPESPVYPSMPVKDITPVEAWITGAMDEARWCERAAFFIGIIGENMEQPGVGQGDLGELYPLSLATLLTAALEHLGESEIDCIEAAAIYAVSMHGEWIAPGLAWLEPFRDTWFRDWRDARPRYAAFARALAPAMDLPEWLHGEGGR